MRMAALHLHSRIKSSCKKDNGRWHCSYRIHLILHLEEVMFNEILPQDLGYVDRSIPENALKLEVDFHVGKKQLKQILEKVINTHGATKTAEVLDCH